jgi:hypothetical protein
MKTIRNKKIQKKIPHGKTDTFPYKKLFQKRCLLLKKNNQSFFRKRDTR